jgi:hypothetical protein
MVDTGAEVSGITDTVADNALAEVQPTDQDKQNTIRTVEGNPVPIKGSVVCQLWVAGVAYPHRMYVFASQRLRTRPYNMVLGTDLLQKFGRLTIDVNLRKIYLADSKRGVVYAFNWYAGDRSPVLRTTEIGASSRSNSQFSVKEIMGVNSDKGVIECPPDLRGAACSNRTKKVEPKHHVGICEMSVASNDIEDQLNCHYETPASDLLNWERVPRTAPL